MPVKMSYRVWQPKRQRTPVAIKLQKAWQRKARNKFEGTKQRTKKSLMITKRDYKEVENLQKNHTKSQHLVAICGISSREFPFPYLTATKELMKDGKQHSWRALIKHRPHPNTNCFNSGSIYQEKPLRWWNL